MLVLAFLIMMFLPNSIEYGYKVNFLGSSIPVIYLVITFLILCSYNRLYAGFKQLPQIGFFLVFALIHTVLTYPTLSNNSFLGLVKGYCPMLMAVYVAGSWQHGISFDRFKKYAFILISLIVPYYLAYAISSSSHSSGWGSGIFRSGISGLPRVPLPIGGPNIVGAILVLTYPLFLHEFTDTEGNKYKKLGKLGLVSGLIGLTFSRGSYLVAAIQSAIHFRYTKSKKILGWTFGLALILVLSTKLSASRVFWAEQVNWKKIESGSTSLTLRAVTYNAMFNRIKSDPLGSGIGKHFVNDHSINSVDYASGSVKLIPFDGRQIMYQSHSSWLLIFVELGWIGGALFFWIFVELIRRLHLAVKISKQLGHKALTGQLRMLVITSVSFIPWLIISDSVFYNFRFAIVFWGVIGCYLALAMKEISEFQTDAIVVETLSTSNLKNSPSY
jgi:O-Antigen ligase